jgi:Type I phosphodiesterase / nucleotide pyrophosphatase
MNLTKSTAVLLGAIALGATVQASAGGDDHQLTQHVLLISIDGMHALDYENCVKDNTCPAMALLGKHGVTYTRTSTSKPSDSFPGLMAIVTGGSPKSVGAFYDVAYDRTLAPPTIETGNGNPPGPCMEGRNNGATTEYEEGNEIDQTQLNGGFSGYSLTDGGIKSIDPRKLNRDPFNHCNPVYAWNFIRTNSIYGVIHNAGGYTAWSDKHAAYAAVNGHTDGTLPTNVDDYYSPEVNSNVIPLPGFRTVFGDDCSVVDPAAGDWTTSFKEIRCYDQLKVNAVLNWIDGKTHLGGASLPQGVRTPVIFGMNFQAVSVGQKLIENGVKGGYKNAAGDPTPDMQNEISFADRAIGQMVAALKNQGLFESTTIIITAKHGQSPIDPKRFFPIPGHSGSNGTSPSTLLFNAGYLAQTPCEFNGGTPPCPAGVGGGLGATEDDISLNWLKDSTNTVAAVNLLEENAATAGIGQIFYGASITTDYNSPLIDSRTPDIIVAPNVGVVYTGSTKKQAEHGGFANDDTKVMLLVSNPRIKQSTSYQFVETKQVAPTILRILGLDPNKLAAVQTEGTAVLPGLSFGGGDD